MGLLDWFRTKGEDAHVESAPSPTSADGGEAAPATFIKGRLSEKAQTEIRRLREFNGEGASHYRWECSQFGCFESKRYSTEGPYEIAHGLARAAPVPGRETACDCDCHVVGSGGEG